MFCVQILTSNTGVTNNMEDWGAVVQWLCCVCWDKQDKTFGRTQWRRKVDPRLWVWLSFTALPPQEGTIPLLKNRCGISSARGTHLSLRPAAGGGVPKNEARKKPEADMFSGASATGNPAQRGPGPWDLFCRQHQHADPSATAPEARGEAWIPSDSKWVWCRVLVWLSFSPSVFYAL